MPSSDLRARAAMVVLSAMTTLAWTPRAAAQQPAEGFAVERLVRSAPGARWVVMDALDMEGGLGGVMALSFGHAHHPLRIAVPAGAPAGSQRLAVVSEQTTADFGFAATYQQFRLYLNLDMPLWGRGESGVVGNTAFAAPSFDAGSHPDTMSDARIGFDARLVGDARSPFRLGAGAQLIVPSGEREDYVSDGTYRAMGRVLFAGDVGAFTYAGSIGLHVRPLIDAETSGSPLGSELLFGVAAGPRFALGHAASFVLGPEIFGETALRRFFAGPATGVEALLTGRVEESGDGALRLGGKLAAGGGLNAEFGAPEWRAVVTIEVSGRAR